MYVSDVKGSMFADLDIDGGGGALNTSCDGDGAENAAEFAVKQENADDYEIVDPIISADY